MKTPYLTIIGISIVTMFAFSFQESLHGVDAMISPTFLPPLKQIKTGILAKYISCNQGLQLVFKIEDGSPACVKPITAQVLIKRGWAETISDEMSQTISQLPKGAQVNLTNVSVWTCGAGRKIATFVGTNGFTNITKANEYGGVSPPDWNDFFDFILKPNSTGHIDMSFEFIGESYNVDNKPFNGTIQSSIGFQRSTVLDFFNKTVIYSIDDPSSPHINHLDGISVFAINIENITNHTLRLTYVIKTDSSAKEGTYGLRIPYTCPLELVTVGNQPYAGSVPWHRPIF